MGFTSAALSVEIATCVCGFGSQETGKLAYKMIQPYLNLVVLWSDDANYLSQFLQKPEST